MRTKATIKDVAQVAGVGIGTVSRVLNGGQHVKEETRLRVFAAIDSLDYQPNQAARRLSSGKTYSIGIVTPFFTRPSFAERLQGIEQTLRESDYDLVLYSATVAEHFGHRVYSLIKEQRVDGLILLNVPETLSDQLAEDFPAFPIVMLDVSAPSDFPCLMIDDVLGGWVATEALIKNGYTRLAYFCDSYADVFGRSAAFRYQGFLNALNEHGLPNRTDWHCLLPHFDTHLLAKQAYACLSRSDRPNAIFASSDINAFTIINVARQLQLRIPQDLAVIGYDDLEAATYMNLTTIRQPLQQSGQLATRALLNLLEGLPHELDFPHFLPLEYIARQTI
ncbi:MAG: LacI family DNA-binding transcriptional regulator [Phototrophicaceae bacterium]